MRLSMTRFGVFIRGIAGNNNATPENSLCWCSISLLVAAESGTEFAVFGPGAHSLLSVRNSVIRTDGRLLDGGPRSCFEVYYCEPQLARIAGLFRILQP